MKEETTSSNNHHYYFPRELITEIISWLPVLCLLRFKCVSKLWYTLIKDPAFVKLHLHRSLEANSNATFVFRSPVTLNCNIFYYRNYNHIRVIKFLSGPPNWVLVSSCNGLVIVSREQRFSQLFSLHNPATGAYKLLPQVDYYGYLGVEPDIIVLPRIVALGYDSASDDYKVWRLDELWNSDTGEKISYKTLLYSLKRDDAWEIIENPPWDDDVIGSKLSTVFVNNSFHWLNPKGRNGDITCFDISTKTYSKMHLPKEISNYLPRLTAFKGKLCIVTYRLDIWILNKYGDNMSWTQLFCNASYDNNIMSNVGNCFTGVDCLQPKEGWPKFVILGIRTIINTVQREWICCNLESGEAKMICMPRFSKDLRLANLYQWVESLVQFP